MPRRNALFAGVRAMQRPDLAANATSSAPSPLGSTDYPARRLRRQRAFGPSSDRLQGSPSENAVLKPRFA